MVSRVVQQAYFLRSNHSHFQLASTASIAFPHSARIKVGAGLRLGDEGVGRVRRAVHQEGAAAFGSVSGVFLLFDARVLDPFVTY